MEVAQGSRGLEERNPLIGTLSVVMGLLACAGVTAIWLVSTPGVDLPGWLRIVSGWMFPIGVFGAIGLAIIARKRHAGVGLSTAGIVLALLSILEFGIMLATNPY